MSRHSFPDSFYSKGLDAGESARAPLFLHGNEASHAKNRDQEQKNPARKGRDARRRGHEGQLAADRAAREIRGVHVYVIPGRIGNDRSRIGSRRSRAHR